MHSTAMEFSHLLAPGVFASYFCLIAGLFFIIAVKSLPKLSGKSSKWRCATFASLALVSLSHTWFYMVKFMEWSFADYELSNLVQSDDLLHRIANWLVGTKLFEQAWAAVSFGPFNWWWSQQLCLFTVGAWTIFLATEGQTRGIKYIWAYMLLGQVVAISVASNLFYLAISLSPSRQKSTPRFATPALWFNVVLSLAAVGLSPFTTPHTFLPNLLAMHALIVIPLIFVHHSAQSKPSLFSIKITTLYSIVAIIAVILHIRTTALAVISQSATGAQSLGGFFISAWDVLYSHPAQSSIGWDVIWTSISFIVWISSQDPKESTIVTTAVTLVASSLASVGVSAPWVWKSRAKKHEQIKSE